MAAKNGLMIVLVVVMMSTLAWGQPPDTVWTRTYGVSARDVCWFVLPSENLGCIWGGVSDERTRLMGMDANGTTLWDTVYAWSGDDERGYLACPVVDGGLMVAGGFYHYLHDENMWIMKLNASRDTVWNLEYGGTYYESCRSIHATSDGNYLVAGLCGTTNTDMLILKVSSDGHVLWHRQFGAADAEDCQYVGEMSDGSYIAIGTYGYLIPQDWRYIFAYKFDSTGTVQWTRNYSLAAPVGTTRIGVQPTSDGGWIVAGLSYLIKVDFRGDTLWTRNFGWAPDIQFHAVMEVPDGGYVAAGYTRLAGNGPADVWLVRTDPNGDTLWTQTFGGDSNDVAMAITRLTDNSYVLGGWTQSYAYANPYALRAWIVRTEPDPTLSIEHSTMVPTGFSLRNFPNPFNPQTEIAYDLPKTERVSLKVFDLLGRDVATLVSGQVEAGSHRVTFDGSGLPSGIYVYRLQAGEFSESRKMVLLK